MIVGLGTDLVHLPRFSKLISLRKSLGNASSLDRLAKRILHPLERSPKEDLRYLAVHWAVKEAAFKAMSTRTRIGWKDVRLIKNEGRPELIMTSDTTKRMGGDCKAHVSISHDGEYVLATVIVEDLR